MSQVERFHPYVSQDVLLEMNKPSLDIATLALGQVIQLDLAEGMDLEDSLQLELTLKDNSPELAPLFDITDGVIPASIIEKNKRYGLRYPDMIGEELIVQGGCTWRKNYMPPFTMVHVHHIDKERHLLSGINLPNGKGMTYVPFVRSFLVK